jgi:hypothetical protein
MDDCLLWTVLLHLNGINIPQCWATFYQNTEDVCSNFDKKMSWATFRAIFSRARLATLISNKEK